MATFEVDFKALEDAHGEVSAWIGMSTNPPDKRPYHFKVLSSQTVNGDKWSKENFILAVTDEEYEGCTITEGIFYPDPGMLKRAAEKKLSADDAKKLKATIGQWLAIYEAVAPGTAEKMRKRGKVSFDPSKLIGKTGCLFYTPGDPNARDKKAKYGRSRFIREEQFETLLNLSKKTQDEDVTVRAQEDDGAVVDDDTLDLDAGVTSNEEEPVNGVTSTSSASASTSEDPLDFIS